LEGEPDRSNREGDMLVFHNKAGGSGCAEQRKHRAIAGTAIKAWTFVWKKVLNREFASALKLFG